MNKLKVNNIMFSHGMRGLPSKSFWFDDHYKTINTNINNNDIDNKNKINSNEGLTKKFKDEYSRLAGIYWVHELSENINAIHIIGYVSELAERKYNPNSIYMIKNLFGDIVANNMNVLELVLKLNELIK